MIWEDIIGVNSNNRTVGNEYESIACNYLAGIGYRIVDRNFHFGRNGEIDIIAIDQGTLVFVECKYRARLNTGDPVEAVDIRKQKRISRTALAYLVRKRYGTDIPIRFDVIGYTGETGELVHITNAFDYVE